MAISGAKHPFHFWGIWPHFQPLDCYYKQTVIDKALKKLDLLEDVSRCQMASLEF